MQDERGRERRADQEGGCVGGRESGGEKKGKRRGRWREEREKRERDLLRKAKEIADKREECDRTVDQVNRKVLELRAQAKTAKKQKTLLEGQSVKVIDNMTTSS